MPTVHLLDYVAGNVRSLANAIEKLGCTIEWVKNPKEIENAEVRSSAYIRYNAETAASNATADGMYIVINLTRGWSFWTLPH